MSGTNEQKLIETIEAMGRSNREARVYLALLKAGHPITNLELVDRAGVLRPTTYVILESLLGLGLAEQMTAGKKTTYTATSPDRLEELIDERADRLADQRARLKKAMPYFRALGAMPQDSPTIQLYNGHDEIRGLFASVYPKLKGKTKEVYGISNVDNLAIYLPGSSNGLVNRDRVDYGVHSKLVYTSSHGAVLKVDDKKYNRDSRYLPPDHYPVEGDINIIGDYVIILSPGKEPVAVSIRNAGIARDMKAIFEANWLLAGQQLENR